MKKYFLQLEPCKELLGPYETVEQAGLDAEALARENGEPMSAIIWGARPATPEDRDLWKDDDEIDVSSPDWWRDLWVPENEAKRFLTSPQCCECESGIVRSLGRDNDEIISDCTKCHSPTLGGDKMQPGIPDNSTRDYPEDFSFENGNYRSECCCCKKPFMGHKRRYICKVCANPTKPGQPTPQESQETASGAALLELAKTVGSTPEELENLKQVLADPEHWLSLSEARYADLRQQLDAARAVIDRLKIPPSAIRDCTLDELIETLGEDHLAAKQIAGLRSMAAKNAKVSEHDLSLLGSVALMQENDKLAARIAELERALASEKHMRARCIEDSVEAESEVEAIAERLKVDVSADSQGGKTIGEMVELILAALQRENAELRKKLTKSYIEHADE